jgi:RHS repeat-associated protein
MYTGLDRFGRVAEVNWFNTSTSSSLDDFQYGYDQDSNVLYKNNILDSVFSELYHQSGAGNGYDGLNQLSAFARGTLSASGGSGTPLDTVASPTETESWGYDALGNFASVTLNGTQTNNTFNQQNEETAAGSHNLSFDKNGNTIVDDSGHSLVYDAWNRLVDFKNGGSVLAAYMYDGLGRRIQATASGTTTDFYFSKDWRELEEDVGGIAQVQYVWSPINVDALVLRDSNPSGGVLTVRLWVQQDANWNVTSIVNSSGAVAERYIYDPYGAVSYLTASWGTLGASQYAWQYLFQAGRLDPVTGQYVFEHRDYSISLGRWSEADPLGFKAGDGNLYRGFANSPAGDIDPSGLLVAVQRYAKAYLPAPSLWQVFGNSLWDSAESWDMSFVGLYQFVTGNGQYRTTLDKAYDIGLLGQSADGPWWSFYGTRGALTVLTGAAVLAAGVGLWSAAGLPTWSVGMRVGGRNCLHIIYGVTRGGVTTWMHGVGPTGEMWTIGASSEAVLGCSFTLEGIPIIFPTAALGGNLAYNCVTAAASSLRKGLIGW